MASREDMLEALFDDIEFNEAFDDDAKSVLRGAYANMSEKALNVSFQLLRQQKLHVVLCDALSRFILEPVTAG